MTRMRLFSIYAIIFLFLAACGGTAEEESPASSESESSSEQTGDETSDVETTEEVVEATATPIPTNTPVPTETPTPEPEVNDTIDIADVNVAPPGENLLIDLVMDMSLTGEIEGEELNDDPFTFLSGEGYFDQETERSEFTMLIGFEEMMSVLFAGEDLGDMGGLFSNLEADVLTEEDGSYITIFGECQYQEGGGTSQDPTQGLLELRDQFGGEIELIESNVTINDLNTNVYAATAENIRTESFPYDNVDLKLYVAEEGNFITRIEMDADGGSILGQDPTMFGGDDLAIAVSIVVDYTPTEEQRDLTEIPVGCDGLKEALAAVDYPTPESIVSRALIFGIYTIETELSIEQVETFYREAMPAEDWELIDESDAFGEIFLVYTKDEETIEITIRRSDTPGLTTVGILNTSDLDLGDFDGDFLDDTLTNETVFLDYTTIPRTDDADIIEEEIYLEYETSSSVESVILLYQTSLPQDGWEVTLLDDEDMSFVYMELEREEDGNLLVIFIEDLGDVRLVTIF